MADVWATIDSHRSIHRTHLSPKTGYHPWGDHALPRNCHQGSIAGEKNHSWQHLGKSRGDGRTIMISLHETKMKEERSALFSSLTVTLPQDAANFDMTSMCRLVRSFVRKGSCWNLLGLPHTLIQPETFNTSGRESLCTDSVLTIGTTKTTDSAIA